MLHARLLGRSGAERKHQCVRKDWKNHQSGIWGLYVEDPRFVLLIAKNGYYGDVAQGGKVNRHTIKYFHGIRRRGSAL